MGGRPCAASSLLSRVLTSAISSATSRTTGLSVASLAIVGRKEASFDPQLDCRLRFFKPSSSDLEDKFLSLVSITYLMEGPYITHSSVDRGLKYGVASS